MKEKQDCEKKSLKQFIKQLVCNYTFVIILFVIFDNLETQIKTLKDYNYIVAYNKSNIKPSKGIGENLKQQILQVLGTKSMTIESIANSILDDNNDDIYAVIYEMLNAEELIIVGNEFATNFDSYIVKKKR